MPNSPLRNDLAHIAALIPSKSTLLELGCGDGALLDHLVKEKNIDGRGIELDPKLVSKCAQKGLCVIQGDAEADLSFYPDHCFDFVVSNQLLQATHKPKELLHEMLRIAGRAVVSIPNFGHWKNRSYLALRGEMPVTKSLSYSWYETPNIHFCTICDFESLIAELGYSVEKKIVLGKGDKPLNALGRMLDNFYAEKAVYCISG